MQARREALGEAAVIVEQIARESNWDKPSICGMTIRQVTAIRALVEKEPK